MDARCSRFPGGHGCGAAGKLRVPGTAHSQGDGINGAEAVNDIHHKKHRDMVAIVLQMLILNIPGQRRTEGPQHRTALRHILLGDVHSE